MALVTVTARIATTHPVVKYGGMRLSRGVLREMEGALNSGTVPMTFNHSSLAVLQTQNLVAEVVELDDGEQALDATFEIEEEAWRSVEGEFDRVGAVGGWSFTAGEPQIRPTEGRSPLIVISADAAAFSDADRKAAWEAIPEAVPAQVNRLFQFSAATEVARVIVEIWPEVAIALGVNLSSSVIYDSLKRLFSKGREQTTIEIRRNYADGTETNAIVTTDDPEVVGLALERLNDRQQTITIVFDLDEQNWQSSES
jgi:hypothetical protein